MTRTFTEYVARRFGPDAVVTGKSPRVTVACRRCVEPVPGHPRQTPRKRIVAIRRTVALAAIVWDEHVQSPGHLDPTPTPTSPPRPPSGRAERRRDRAVERANAADGIRIRRHPTTIPWTTPADLTQLLARRPDLHGIGLAHMTEVLTG
jgi:hypothetical protein